MYVCVVGRMAMTCCVVCAYVCICDCVYVYVYVYVHVRVCVWRVGWPWPVMWCV